MVILLGLAASSNESALLICVLIVSTICKASNALSLLFFSFFMWRVVMYRHTSMAAATMKAP